MGSTGVLSFFWRHGNLFTLAVKPGFLDFDNLPDTNFSCENKVIGGYYADVETGCQMFHVCTLGQKGEVTDIKFLCLNGTVFDQETRVCERLDEVDCSKSESYFDLNLELYGNNGGGFGIEAENESTGNRDKEEEEEKCDENDEGDDCKGDNGDNDEEFVDEYDDSTLPPTTTTTTTTTTTPRTTTARVSFTTRPALKITPPPTIQYPPNPPANIQFNTNYPQQNIQYPPSSPETVAALLALHNAFQESLKHHDSAKHPLTQPPSPSPPSSQRTLPPQVPKQKDVSQSRPSQPPSTSRFSTPLYNQNLKPSGFSINNYHPPQQNQFAPKTPQFHFETTSVSKPSFVHSTVTSERFGTPNFHHGFHINSQANANPNRHQFSTYQQPNLRYFDGNKPNAAPLAGGAVPKPFNYPQPAQESLERKPDSSLRLRQSEDIGESEEGDEILEDELANGQKSLESHSSFVRAIPESSSPKQARKVVYPSLTTPAVSVVLTTSSISSSRAQSVNVKNAQSAILKPSQGPVVQRPSVKPYSVRQNSSVSVRSEKPKTTRPSFAQYQDEHANYETFFTDVSKIRSKRDANESAIDVVKQEMIPTEDKKIAQCINNSTLKGLDVATPSDKELVSKKTKRKAHSNTSLKNFHNVDFELLPSMTTVMKPVNFKVKKKLRSVKTN